MKLWILIRDKPSLSPWHAFNARCKNHHTVVEGTTKKGLWHCGTWTPKWPKLTPHCKSDICLVLSQRRTKTQILPKFTSLSSSETTLNIILFTLTYEVRLFPQLHPFSIRNYKSIYSLQGASFGVGPQPSGRTSGGRERSVTQAVWPLAGQQRCLQFPEGHQDLQHHLLEAFVLPELSASDMTDLWAGPTHEILALSLKRWTGISLSDFSCLQCCFRICSCPSFTLGLMKVWTNIVT